MKAEVCKAGMQERGQPPDTSWSDIILPGGTSRSCAVHCDDIILSLRCCATFLAFTQRRELTKMPSAIPTKRERITKFTNCRLLKGNKLVNQDLWVSSGTGKILRSQEIFYGQQIVPDAIINLGGRIVSPGLIDVQLNGAFGFDFSSVPEDMSTYGKTLKEVNKSLIQTGITAYLPTLTSQRKEVYHKVSRHSFFLMMIMMSSYHVN